MIVGGGLIANAMAAYKDRADILIFASGVSNSAEKNESNFEREKLLLLSKTEFNIPIVYFSTCSVFDTSLLNSPYINHKLQMEALIKENYEKYYILRLPTLVGKTNNPNTFFNSIKNKLVTGEAVSVYNNAERYLLDVDDLNWIVNTITKKNKNSVLNIVFDNKVNVSKIILYMHQKLKSKSQIVFENKGSNLIVDSSEFNEILSKLDVDVKSNSYTKIIDKYLKYL